MKTHLFLTVLLSCLLVSVASFAQSSSGGNPVLVNTAGGLALQTGYRTGTLGIVTNGNSTSDCTAGGGTNFVLCVWTGSAWGTFATGTASAAGVTGDLQANSGGALSAFHQLTVSGSSLVGSASLTLNLGGGAPGSVTLPTTTVTNANLVNSSVTVNLPSSVFSGSGALSLGNTQTFNLINQSGSTVFGNCTGSTGTPSFCTITGGMLGLTTNGDVPAIIGGNIARVALGGPGTFMGNCGGALGYCTPAGALPSGSQGFPLTNNNGLTGYHVTQQAIDASAFSGTDPCNTLNLALQQQAAVNTAGIDIDARGLTVGSGHPCTYFTANFLGGVTFSQMGGTMKLPSGTLWVPFVPSQYGCVTANCTNGPFPPRGIIVCPNKYHCLEGVGRGDTNGQNTTIAVCGATHTTPACNTAGTNVPVQRMWGVAAGSTITTVVPAQGSCQVSLGAPFSGHRCYMQVLTAGNNYTATCGAPVSSVVTCTVNSNSPTNNISGELSGGMTITLGGAFTVLTGSQTVADGSGAAPAPTTNGSGQTVFTIATSTACGVCTGTITVGFNVLGGEHVLISGSTVLNNNFNWRVCQKTNATGGTYPNIGAQLDTNCPANPTNASFYVVGTSADQLFDFAGAVLSTSCSANCGTLTAEIPIIDYGSNPGTFQFGMFVSNLTLACSTVPSCVNFRSMTGNEQSGMYHVLMNGSSMWCADWWTNNAQDANSWNDIECIGGAFNGSALSNITIGTAGFIVSESGMRAMRGATANYNSAGGPLNTGNYGTAQQGTIPGCGFVFENTTGTEVSAFHAEGFQFNRCFGIELPSQGFLGQDNGGQSVNSCGNVTSGTGGQGCAADDGPFANIYTTSVAPGASGQNALTFASSPAGCLYNATIPTTLAANGLGMMVTIEAIGANHASCNASTGLGTGCPETVSVTGPITGGGPFSLPISVTQNAHNTAATQISCSWSSAEMVSGNFPLAIGGGQSGPWSGDYAFHATKKNTGAMLSVIDDYTGSITNDNQVMFYGVDSSLSGGTIQRKSTSGIIKDLSAQCLLGGATGTASPAACGYSTIGKVAIPSSAGTTYTVNEATVGTNSLITVQQTTDNTGLPNSPTCNSNAELPSVSQITKSNGVSFTLNGLSNPAAITCFTYQVQN